MIKKLLIMLSLSLILVACSQSKMSKERFPASSGVELTETEVKLVEDLESVIGKFSKSKEISTEIRNSEQALEFVVIYDHKDRASLEVYSGIRMRAIKVLFNELYLELQQQENPKLDLANRKKLLINFYRED